MKYDFSFFLTPPPLPPPPLLSLYFFYDRRSRGARRRIAEYVTNQRATGIVGIHGNRRGDEGSSPDHFLSLRFRDAHRGVGGMGGRSGLPSTPSLTRASAENRCLLCEDGAECTGRPSHCLSHRPQNMNMHIHKGSVFMPPPPAAPLLYS